MNKYVSMFGIKFGEKAKEAKDAYMKLLLRDGAIEEMDHDTLDAIQSGLKFLEAANQLVEQQTKAIDEMNDKLDKLLAK